MTKTKTTTTNWTTSWTRISTTSTKRVPFVEPFLVLLADHAHADLFEPVVRVEGTQPDGERTIGRHGYGKVGGRSDFDFGGQIGDHFDGVGDGLGRAHAVGGLDEEAINLVASESAIEPEAVLGGVVIHFHREGPVVFLSGRPKQKPGEPNGLVRPTVQHDARAFDRSNVGPSFDRLRRSFRVGRKLVFDALDDHDRFGAHADVERLRLSVASFDPVGEIRFDAFSGIRRKGRLEESSVFGCHRDRRLPDAPVGRRVPDADGLVLPQPDDFRLDLERTSEDDLARARGDVHDLHARRPLDVGKRQHDAPERLPCALGREYGIGDEADEEHARDHEGSDESSVVHRHLGRNDLKVHGGLLAKRFVHESRQPGTTRTIGQVVDQAVLEFGRRAFDDPRHVNGVELEYEEGHDARGDDPAGAQDESEQQGKPHDSRKGPDPVVDDDHHQEVAGDGRGEHSADDGQFVPLAMALGGLEPSGNRRLVRGSGLP